MTLPRYCPGPIDYWLSQAATEFVNGAISGIKLGGLIGGGSGVSASLSPVGEGMPAFKQVILAVSGFLVTMIASGIAAVSKWHENGNPFPNPLRPCANKSTIPNP